MTRLLQRLHATCLYGLPASLLPPRTDTEAWRGLCQGERYRHLPRTVRLLLGCVAFVGYPVALVRAILRSIRQLRRTVPTAGAIEALRMYRCALLRNIPPVEYVYYGFHEAGERARAPHYLFWTDTPALTRLNRERGACNNDVQDKARFANLCEQHGLPHVRTVAAVRQGQQVEGTPLAELSLARYWIKPLAAHAGAGSHGWDYDGNVWRSGDRTLSPGQWHSSLLSQDCIVQEQQTNHPELHPLSSGAVITVRLTTTCSRSLEVHLIGATAALPCGQTGSGNDAIACRIDPDTGQINRALQRGNTPVALHPDSGAVLLGSSLPLWQECVQCVLQAHRTAFSAFASLGWDVVITPSGPLLLEANSGWNPLGQQFNFGPLGLSPLGAIIGEEVRRLQ